MQLIFDPSVNLFYRLFLGSFFVINLVLAFFIIFMERDRREATSTWAWLLLLFVVPVLGFFSIFILRTGRQTKKY